MNKKSLQYHFAKLRRVKTWQLLVLLVISAVISVSLLRLNNLGMVERRSAVVKADEAGDKQQMRKTLVELQAYVIAHMNTSLDKGIYLEKQYDRDRDAALASVSDASNPNAAVYQQASIECRARWRGGVASFRNDYVQCVAERVKALGAANDPSRNLKLPLSENYHYNFISPKWSPDLAGFSVLIVGLITSVILIRIVTLGILKILLKYRFRAA